MVEIPKIRRRALLPVIKSTETRDPPSEIVEQFRIHDILLFIGYLREQGITFENLTDLKREMPNLYERADEVLDFGGFHREGSTGPGGWSYSLYHKPNLVLTRTFNYRKEKIPPVNNRAPEIVAALRELYLEGFSLQAGTLLQREMKGLWPAINAGISRTCWDIDFGYFDSINKLTDSKREIIHDWDVRVFNELDYGAKITRKHRMRFFAGRNPMNLAALVAGIDAFKAQIECEGYQGALIRTVTDYLEKRQMVPADVVRELRKQFFGKNDLEIRLGVVHHARSYLAKTLNFDGVYDLFDESGFKDMGQRRFGFAKFERSLDARCEDALVKIYQRSNRRLIYEEFKEDFCVSFNHLYNALFQKYGGRRHELDWNKVLVDFYGLRGLTFVQLDPDTANVNARHVAEQLRLKEKDFYKFAEIIGLPLAGRDTVTYRFVHEENVRVILERASERFRHYEEVLRKAA